MSSFKVHSYVFHTDICRCCLSASGTWDLTSPYIADTGVKEVLSDILQECLGLTISHLNEWSSYRVVCSMCMGYIRNADTFRKQVLKAERVFAEYWNSQGELNLRTNLKVAEGTKKECSERKRHKLKINKKQKEVIINAENDSDTTIAKLTSKSVPSDLLNEKYNLRIQSLQPLGCQLEKNIQKHNKVTNTAHQLTRVKKDVKHTSERKRVMLTCGIILRDTTACPFRHHKSWFQCFFCSKEFMEINLLRDHNSQIHLDIDAELKKMKRYPRSLQIEISNLECRHCSLNLSDVDGMRRHFVEVHDKVIYNECIADYKVNASPYNCHICNKEFHVFRTLTTHLNEHYANCICDVCGKPFLNSKRLKVHKRTHENGYYPCTKCGKIFKTKTSKANHIESAHAKRVLKCQICLKPMKHYNDRVKHMSDVHNITHKFKCHICFREYKIKHYLTTHIRQTHGNKNKKCTECGMAFITNHGLKKHMAKHTGEKPFKCSICCKSYARNYTLREHMRSHDNETLGS